MLSEHEDGDEELPSLGFDPQDLKRVKGECRDKQGQGEVHGSSETSRGSEPGWGDGACDNANESCAAVEATKLDPTSREVRDEAARQDRASILNLHPTQGGVSCA